MVDVPDPQYSSQPGAPAARGDFIENARRFLNEYAWFIVRNVVGWLMILAAPPLGFVVPGPGGLPVFLIGFALVTFPGKRRLTARVLRGRRLRIEDRAYTFAAAFVSILVPALALYWIAVRWEYEQELRRVVRLYAPKRWVWVLSAILVATIVWLVTRLSLKILNGLLRLLPRFRRKFRPWLRKKGLKLLPPRRRKAQEPLPEDEILEIAPRHQHRLRRIWKSSQTWLKRLVAIGLTAWVFWIMVRPLHSHWDQVKEQIAALRVWQFLLASVMFSVFLLVFRAVSWRKVLKGFGYRLPQGAATRIWSTSELARYLPGAIWQVVGRVYLCKPYGVPKEVVMTSQILEVCVFLFANVLIAAACLLWFGQKVLAASHARPWLITALALVPMLALLLHPKIFYAAVNGVLRRVGKEPIVKRLRGRKLVGLLFWMMLGLVWQSVAVYLIVDPVLHFYAAWWWVIAGAYCLAWIAGFLAFWAPGGIGVRELVFVTTMQAILPHQIREQFPNKDALEGLLVLLGFLLRLWTVLGEGMLTGVAYVWDYKGAMQRPDAPGQIAHANGEPPPSGSRGTIAAAGRAS